jgi:hypothetical protein
MTLDDGESDPVLDNVRNLRPCDISQRHANRLRRRCHAQLQRQPERRAVAGTVNGTRFRRLIAPALAGAWCLAYLAEIVRGAAVAYGLRP